jgi:hypothetical protein
MLAILVVTLAGCKVNPFAPRLDTSPPSGLSTGDQRTIDGLFQNFQVAYTLKDTAIYGKLIDGNFTFIYRDYDNNVDVSWGRDDEMLTTYGLFRNTDNVDLTWNSIVFEQLDSVGVSAQVIRSFHLRVSFDATDVADVTGNANISLTRPTPTDVWKISQWRDESNY